MGVTNLWQILEPVKQHVPLHNLKGKTLAVDLSLWVCEAQTVKKMMGIVTKPHLRNLFFRLSFLTLMDIHLVFVMEGDPPKLKANTMEKRTEIRFGPSKKSRTARTGRSRFKSLLKECLEMLECLGVPWVQAAGEAEAMCAYLNASGFVDGCITNDGDAFLYGALTVYRNFTMNIKDPHVDCYSISAIEKKLGFSRESLIGLAILLGCDYLPKGVPGVGKEQALRLISTLGEQSLLQRFEHWKGHFQSSNIPPIQHKKLAHCAVCHHPGSSKEHGQTGCHLCGTVGYCEPHDAEYCCPCDWHASERHWRANSVEEAVRKKAIACEGFPFPEVIREYLISKDKLMKLNECQRPNLLTFQRFASEKMDWTKHYACEKLCALLTNYDMNKRRLGQTDPQQLQALRIVKTRTKNGIPCFEIEWQKPEHYAVGDDQPEEPFMTTIEEAMLFQAAYPEVVALYQMQKLDIGKEKKKGKKTKLKEKECLASDSEVANLFSQLNLESAYETFPCKDEKSEFEPVSAFTILPEKGSESQSSHVASQRSTPVGQSQNPSPTSLITASQNTKEECNLGGPVNSQAEFPKESAAFPASPAIANLQLSGIDWEGTSFNVSPKQVDVACYLESESHVCTNSIRPHSLMCCELAKTIMPSSDSVQYNPDLLSSADCAASGNELPKSQSDVSLKEEAILEPSILEAFSKAADTARLSALQTVEQIKGTVSLREAFSSLSFQLNDSTQKAEKYSRRFDSQSNKEMLKSSKNPVKAEERLIDSDTCASVGLCHETLGLTCLENKPQALPLRSTEGIDHCQVRKNSRPPILKSSLKKSVCQNSYSSEDSDSENMKDRRKGHRMPRWQKKCDLVKSKNKYIDKMGVSQLVQEMQQRREEPEPKAPGMGFSVIEQPTVPIPNPPRLIECKPRGSNPPLEESGSESDGSTNSPLPLSERLKLRLQNS
ncbi:flap endonuclease GEN homolog 1 [Sceloporus undulatus]|uniref:flap endonuclease GEN homolog 1 n=1 Tax=Sceloporus undulatus TaxID=8520 RepID=UPI001C4B558D|nr:flap endonuclease GEN homolog 1 [Sceloporus undulatus]XP_042301505.1 flap endonuclease GEN homolog 1 [Sceloporus undulatus]